MIEIELPDGSIAEFPDGTDDRTIERALASFARSPEAVATADPASDPTEGMSGWERARAGFGKSAVDFGRGLVQSGVDGLSAGVGATRSALSGMGLPFYDPAGIAPRVQSAQDHMQRVVDQARNRDVPLMNTGAGIAGNIAGQIALASAVPGGAGPKLIGAGLQNAAFAGMQPVASEESREGNMLRGGGLGVAGKGLAIVAGRLGKGLSDKIDPAKLALIERARELGIPVNASQVMDSRFMKMIASVVNQMPFSGAGKAAQAQRRGFNRAVADTIGEKADLLSPEVMRQARDRIGSQFDALAERSPVKIDDRFLNELATIADEAKRLSPDDSGRAVAGVIDDLLSKAKDSVIPGEVYKTFSTKLRELGASKDRFGGYVSKVRDSLETALGRSLKGADKEAWTKVRRQYSNLKTVEKLAAKGDGNVAPAQLSGKMNSGRRTTAYGGQGTLGDLARIGSGVLRDPIPDSGTAGRMLGMGALSGGALFGGDMGTMAGLAAMSAGMGHTLNSQAFARYLTHGLGRTGRAALWPAQLAPTAAPATERAWRRRRPNFLGGN